MRMTRGDNSNFYINFKSLRHCAGWHENCFFVITEVLFLVRASAEKDELSVT